MEVKPLATAPIVMPAPAPAPAMPIAPMPHPHDHIHLHASYKHTAIVMPEVKPVAHVPVHACPPVVAPHSAAWILVLFILLVIVARSFRI